MLVDISVHSIKQTMTTGTIEKGTMERIIGITLTCTIYLAACSLYTQTMSLSGKADPTYTFRPSQQIYVALSEPKASMTSNFESSLLRR